MKKWAIYLVALCVSVCLAGTGRAVSPIGPFVGIGVEGQNVDLGTFGCSGSQSLTKTLKVHVVANCPHRVQASFAGFKHEQTGRMMTPEHLSLMINGRGVPVGKDRVEILSSAKPTPVKGVKVPVELRFGMERIELEQAGEYHGTLTLTVTPRL